MKKCLECGKEIPWSDRSDKKYCGQNCRKRASRRAESMTKQAHAALRLIQDIAGQTSDKRYRDHALRLLDELQLFIGATVTTAAVTIQDHDSRDTRRSHTSQLGSVPQTSSRFQAANRDDGEGHVWSAAS